MSIFNYLTADRIKAIVDKLAPRFIGKDQDHLLAVADEAAGTAYDLAYDYTNAQLAGKVDIAGDTMTGKLTNEDSIHVTTGTMVLGAPTPESLYWNYTYPGNTYLTMDKNAADNDASLVFTQAGRAKWEFGATTESPGASPRMHLKVVRNPDSNPAHDQFLDVLIGDYDTGNLWVTSGYKLGIGGLPSELLHVSTVGASTTRTLAKIENYNATGSGSKSAALWFSGPSTSWIMGNDFGLNGGHNFFIQDNTNGNVRYFDNGTGAAFGTSTLASTEAMRVESTTGGLLLPRLTTTQRDALGSKNAGLTLYNSTAATIQFWNGATWAQVPSTFTQLTDTAAGSFTPTVTNVANIASASLDSFMYTRTGSLVTFAAQMTVTATANATVTSLRLSLPVASNFANNQDAAGVMSVGTTVGFVRADPATDTLFLQYTSNSTGATGLRITGMYQII